MNLLSTVHLGGRKKMGAPETLHLGKRQDTDAPGTLHLREKKLPWYVSFGSGGVHGRL